MAVVNKILCAVFVLAALFFGPWLVWNQLLVQWISDLPELGILHAPGVALLLWCPWLIARCIVGLPAFVKRINRECQEDEERAEIRKQVAEAIAAGKTLLAAEILKRQRQKLYGAVILQIAPLIDAQIAKMAG
jgi:hypothetical protein